MAYLLDPPGLDEEAAAFWQDIRDAAIAVIPEWARQMYGYEAPQFLTTNRRTEIRQSLGVLDALFLSQPGPVTDYISVLQSYMILQRINLGCSRYSASCPPPGTGAPSRRKSGASSRDRLRPR
jgi:hypothetical protein